MQAKKAVGDSNRLADNLSFLMQHYQLTETEVARRTGVGQPVVHRMACGSTDNPKIKTISPVANLFGLSISQLLTQLPPTNQLQVSLSDNVHFGWHALPLIALADLTDTGMLAPLCKTTQDVAYTECLPSTQTYALQLDDDSLSPQFPKGTTIIIEPDVAPVNGAFAVVLPQPGKAAVFRKLLFHGDDVYCQSFHPESATTKMTGSFESLGCLVQARVDLKR